MSAGMPCKYGPMRSVSLTIDSPEYVVKTVMLDHPGWISMGESSWIRPMRDGINLGFVGATREGDCIRLANLSAATSHSSFVHTADIANGSSIPRGHPLSLALGELGTVARIRNSDPWDALLTSIVRQVIRAPHATRLYRQLCREFGECIALGTTEFWCSPGPAVILSLTDVDFKRLGLSFKQDVLRSAAAHILDEKSDWADLIRLDRAAAKTELQRIPRVGPWTSGATIADLTNDFSAYPVGDLAVRTWAKLIAPSFDWPIRENDFEELWRRIAKSYVSEVTMLALAWGGTHGTNTLRASSRGRR